MTDVPEFRVLSCGDAALLVEAAGLDEAIVAADRLRAAAAGGLLGPVVDLVPGACTVLVRTQPGEDLELFHRRVSVALNEGGTTARLSERSTVIIPVRYDGPDLPRVADLTGLSIEDVVAAHTDTAWTCAFTGFAPGFGYLTGGDPRLAVARRETPRTVVPAGSVGLAGGLSGVYPVSSPGGWQLIGRTDLVLWDAQADPPATIRPGTRVRFVRQ